MCLRSSSSYLTNWPGCFGNCCFTNTKLDSFFHTFSVLFLIIMCYDLMGTNGAWWLYLHYGARFTYFLSKLEYHSALQIFKMTCANCWFWSNFDAILQLFIIHFSQIHFSHHIFCYRKYFHHFYNKVFPPAILGNTKKSHCVHHVSFSIYNGVFGARFLPAADHH
jgi:hypothetical protein